MTIEQFSALVWDDQGRYLVLPDRPVIDKYGATPLQMLRAALDATAAAWRKAAETREAGGPWDLEYTEELWRLHIETVVHACWTIERMTSAATDSADLTSGAHSADENDGWCPY